MVAFVSNRQSCTFTRSYLQCSLMVCTDPKTIALVLLALRVRELNSTHVATLCAFFHVGALKGH